MAKSDLLEIIVNEDLCTGCRICQMICSSIYQNEIAPSKAYIQISDYYELRPHITFLEGCTHCGQCARHCLYGALQLNEGEK